jgi:hypothetical protein
MRSRCPEHVRPDTYVLLRVLVSDASTFLTNISKQHRAVIISVAHFHFSFRVRLLQYCKEQGARISTMPLFKLLR